MLAKTATHKKLKYPKLFRGLNFLFQFQNNFNDRIFGFKVKKITNFLRVIHRLRNIFISFFIVVKYTSLIHRQTLFFSFYDQFSKTRKLKILANSLISSLLKFFFGFFFWFSKFLPGDVSFWF